MNARCYVVRVGSSWVKVEGEDLALTYKEDEAKACYSFRYAKSLAEEWVRKNPGSEAKVIPTTRKLRIHHAW